MPRTLPAADPTTKQAPAFDCWLSRSERHVAWVHAAGELDIATAPQLELTLRQAVLGSRIVVLDLRDLSFIDSCGVHVIDIASDRARRLGRRLVVLRGPPNVTRILALTSITDDFELDHHQSRSPLTAAANRGQRVADGAAARGAARALLRTTSTMAPTAPIPAILAARHPSWPLAKIAPSRGPR